MKLEREIYRRRGSFFLSALLQVFGFLILIGVTSQSYSQCCTYHLSMHDSYGDGWNGGFLQVNVNGISQGIFSASNYSSSDSFTVCNGNSISLTYTAGSFENENSYQLYDASWNVLYANGPNPTVGSVYSTSGNCNTTINPGNNSCTALPIDTGQCIWSSNFAGSGTFLNPGCAVYAGGDIWFKLIVPPSGNVGFETDSGTINDTGLAIWKNSCSSPQIVTCDDDGGNNYYSKLNVFGLTPGSTIFIQVFGYNGSTGSFKLCAKNLGVLTVDSSTLPIVLLNTLGQTITQGQKINALMEIKYNGPGSFTQLTDSSNVYNGHIGIDIRGASSSGYPQPPYGIETRTASGANNNVVLFNMPKEHDWVMLSNYNDRSMIRNSLAFKLFADMGNYAPRTQFCEVLIDSSYKGIYLFGEKIKRDSDRVHIARLKTTDSSGDQLSGGYIIQQNLWDNSNSFLSNYSPIDHPTFDVHFVYEYPSSDSITSVQKTYIAGFIDSLETALYSSNFADTALGYRKYLDISSFIDYFLVNELARNADGFKKSVFFHKNRHSKGGKLKAGPVWDFDWAWKNLYGCPIYENTDGSGWAHKNNDCTTDNYSCGYYVRMLQDVTFQNELRCTYENYRQTFFDTTYLFNYIDSVEQLMQPIQQRHFIRWPILGTSGPAPELGPFAANYSDDLDTLKQWIRIRIQWLDSNIAGICNQSPTSANSFYNTKNSLQVFPNPSNGIIQFNGQLMEESAMLEIYDVFGRKIHAFNLSKGKVEQQAVFSSSGIYVYRLLSSNKVLISGEFVIQHQD